jgi:hypothetical protein
MAIRIIDPNPKERMENRQKDELPALSFEATCNLPRLGGSPQGYAVLQRITLMVLGEYAIIIAGYKWQRTKGLGVFPIFWQNLHVWICGELGKYNQTVHLDA